MSSQATSNFRRNRKANLIKVCGGKCNLCGYDKTNGALEFHHINPEEKSYGLSSTGTCHQLETDLQEVKKCILVCSNCHREIHEGLHNNINLLDKRIYLDEVAEQLIKDRDNSYKATKCYCKSCGKEISKTSTYCEDCIGITRRVVKDRPTRDELKKLIRTKPFTQIGTIYGVTDNAIRKWCDALNLPRKSTEIKKYTDEEWASI